MFSASCDSTETHEKNQLARVSDSFFNQLSFVKLPPTQRRELEDIFIREKVKLSFFNINQTINLHLSFLSFSKSLNEKTFQRCLLLQSHDLNSTPKKNLSLRFDEWQCTFCVFFFYGE